jgi:hypothetical protein
MGPVSDRTLSVRAAAVARARVRVRVAVHVVVAVVLVIAVGGVAALPGCGGSSAPAVKPRPTITLVVTPSRTSNRGRPMHAVVRAVTLKQFVEDQDRSIAQLVVSPDDSVLSTFVVFPGVAQKVTVEPPVKGAVAVYFLFTGATGTSWKKLFENPPATVRIELADDEIADARKATP